MNLWVRNSGRVCWVFLQLHLAMAEGTASAAFRCWLIWAGRSKMALFTCLRPLCFSMRVLPVFASVFSYNSRAQTPLHHTAHITRSAKAEIAMSLKSKAQCQNRPQFQWTEMRPGTGLEPFPHPTPPPQPCIQNSEAGIMVCSNHLTIVFLLFPQKPLLLNNLKPGLPW